MRRGHIGIGGWRNENPRYYRPRVGGNPHYRPVRSYGLLEIPRFPPPNVRPVRSHFSTCPETSNRTDYSDRHRYRNNPHHNAYQRTNQQGDRQLPHSQQWSRHRTVSHSYRNESHSQRIVQKESPKYYEDLLDDHHNVNSMGDVDHRHILQLRDNYATPLIPPWSVNQSPQCPSEKINNNAFRQKKGDINKHSVASSSLSSEYTGHRPPASDHYGCNPSSVIDNSDTFSRSVDDTVDLIRKRLLNRTDPQSSSDNFEISHNNTIANDQKLETSNFQGNNLNEQPMRKKYHRQRLAEKSNCAKIKNNIVNQLFKMDKEKIHKLMDNPNSSTKFEYAISSLITESQNSFNRHLRSTAEKSLCSSSSDFIQDDNNTIYEDTFMKQMQCILDPQDTVFLEDIKPFVMAELNKVLQLNENEQHYHIGDDVNANTHDEHYSYNQNVDNVYNYENFNSEANYTEQNNMLQDEYPKSKSVLSSVTDHKLYENMQSNYDESKPLFERRERRSSFNIIRDNTLSENRFYGRSAEQKSIDDISRPHITPDLFDTNTEQFSEEDDPFAEFDKQYHVAVDPDFIEDDDNSNQKQETENIYNINYTKTMKTEPVSPEKSFNNTDKDNDGVFHDDGILHDKEKSSLISSLICNTTSVKQEHKDTIIQCKQEPGSSINILPLQEKKSNDNICKINENVEQKKEPDTQEISKEIDKILVTTNVLKSTSSNSRKRSIDQRPAHRKEKRKKSESSSSESSKQILNKNIIINVNDCSSKNSDKCEASKSIFNLFFSKEDNKSVSKDNKNSSLNDKNYTEKHVKRKETPKQTIKKDNRTKRKDSTSSNQTTSPTENPSMNNETPTKPEVKTILKPIDMFNEQPRKINIHQAHRNTALTPHATSKVVSSKKTKLKGPLSRQLLKRHVAVQVMKKVHAKETQTPKLSCCGDNYCQTRQKKYVVKSVQTDMNIAEKNGNKSNDAFERMKEIDLEIQVLLQEKFKLYSSIETKDTGTNSMQTLGMTVLNVTPFNGEDEIETTEGNETTDNILSEDTIVDDFTNIPVEELEQIALESVHENATVTADVNKRSLRRKISYQEDTKSQSPITVQKRKNLKAKSPNISLIEQIITDDRPLEDIISLDDLEIPQTKTANKNQKTKRRRKKAAKRRIVQPPVTDYTIKPCSVVLVRADISKYQKEMQLLTPDSVREFENLISEETHSEINLRDTDSYQTNLNMMYSQDEIVEEAILNDIQFDMLDVSEDIVVGDSYDIKALEDKEAIENVAQSVSEEIILDNSQSSIEDTSAPALGQSGECKVYDYSADENLRRDSIVVNGNADAVLAIEYVENNFLAACLDGNVYYFNGDGQLLTTLRGSNLAVTCLTIVKEKYGTTVYTGSLDSRIRYYDLETGLEKGPECNVLSPIQTMDRAWDTVFVGTRTGFVLQFECKNNMLIPVSSVKFSDQSILALRAMKEGPRKVLLVAARSENVTIKDAQTGLLLRTLVGPKMTVYTLLYEDGKVYCGTSSHQIHVFDYSSGSHVGAHEGGKGAVCLRATGGLLFAGCYDGCVYVYREGEGQPFAQVRGPSLMLLSLAVVGTKIIAGYKDRSLYIWKIPLCILQEMIL